MTDLHEDPSESSSVRVAVRIRPFIKKELVEGPQVCVTCVPEHNAVVLGQDRQFDFDKVFPMDAQQLGVFDYCVKDLVLSCFSGYNATVLAYGQTGSGKTYTMGTGQRLNLLEEEIGIIPRVISSIIQETEKRKTESEFVLKVAFLEIYNEELLDLLDPKPGAGKQIIIREDRGTISLMGMHEEKVATADEMLSCLDKGSLNRSTAATLMNELSSRSHAIFTISIEQHALTDPEEQGYTCAKFHFVDLAGSERAKRTGASGTTMKEGISINKGLLCLGNVISALTEDVKKNVHVPYRDSKLTRILQDSLGGNSKTCMIACISPADTNYEETLNSLKYASRARHIKNKPVINRDPNSALIAQLRQEIFHLKAEVKTYQRVVATGDLSELSVKGMAEYQDEDEVRQLKITIQQQERKITQLTAESQEKSCTLEGLEVKTLIMQRERDIARENLEKAIKDLKNVGIDFEYEGKCSLAEEFAATVAELQGKIREKEASNQQLVANFEALRAANDRDLQILHKKTMELENLRRKVTVSQVDTGNQEVEQAILSNMADYGKLFAASILQTIEQGSDLQAESPIEEVCEVDSAQEATLRSQESEITTIEGAISQKEDLLHSIEDTLRTMQSKLVAEMNQQYHRKIAELEQELRTVEQERESSIVRLSSAADRKAVEEKYRNQLMLLEEKLRENKRKDREQSALYKTLETQKTQIAKLADEIQKAKQQKLLLVKRHKAELDNYQKWKTERTKELLLAKKQNLKKDQQIAKLIQEGKKKEGVAKRKAEELASLQKRQKEIIGRLKGKGTEEVETLREWVGEFMRACLEERTVRERLGRESGELEELGMEMERLRNGATDTAIRLERAVLEYNSPSPSAPLQDLSEEIQRLKTLQRETDDHLETLELNLRHKQDKVESLREAVVQSPVEDIRSRCTALRTLADSQNLIAVLFEQLVTFGFQVQEVNLSLRRADVDLEAAKNAIQQALQDKEVARLEHHRAEERLRAELREQEMRWLEEMKTQQPIIVPVESPEDWNLEKRCAELEGQLAEREKSIEVLRKQVESKSGPTLSRKISGENKEESKRPPAGFTSLQQARAKKLKGKKTDEDTPKSGERRGSLVKSSPGWRCIQTTEAHSAPVSALCCYENMLFTASNKVFKVWAAEGMTQVSEVPAHSSYIRAMALWAESSVVLTGCQGVINIWDTISLQSAGVLQEHNDEVRAMRMFDRYLITAGKSQSAYSVFIWDLRRYQHPVAEMEPNNDIYSLDVLDNTLFYAGKDRTIHKVSLTTFEPLDAIQNVHADTVTGVGVLNGAVMSASVDKCVKLWSPAASTELSSVGAAHNEAILCLESDGETAITGGKEGKMKLWRGTGLTCAGELSGHRGPVNCVGVLKAGDSIVSGAGDKCVKLWRLREEAEDA